MSAVDADSRAFMELVDCKPWEILEIARQVGQSRISSKRPSSFVVPFGRYQGRSIGDVSSQYLRWSVGVKAWSRNLRRFQREAHIELERRNRKAKKKKQRLKGS